MSQYLAAVELSSLDGSNGFKINGQAAYDYSGVSVASAGDVNGDGFADLIIGSYASPNGHYSGAAYVVFGKAAGFGATLELSSLDGSNGFKINGEAERDFSGFSSSAGDVNGDGFSDLIVSAPGADPNGSSSGATYVVFGGVFGATLELSTLDGSNGFKIDGEAAHDGSGISVSSAGDVNGDGFADLIIGAPYANPNGIQSGASYVVFGMASGFGATLELSTLDGSNGFKIDGEATGYDSGRSVSSAGDVNGDGFADLIIGAHYAHPNGIASGASYVVFGKASGFGATLELSSLDGSNGFKINGQAAYDNGGKSVSSAGDVNGDGFADLIVGAWRGDPNGTSSGASYVVFGKASGFAATLELSSLDGSNGFKIDGQAQGDYSGISVSSAGDVNGDGFADLIVGAESAGPNGNSSGASYVVFGKASSFGATLALSSLDGNNGFKLNGAAAYDYSGSSVAAAGDVNGDGFADLIVGALRADPNGNNSGASYVVFGSMPGEAVIRTGTAIANTIHGGNFDDTLNGLGGNDTLYGHGGADTLDGGSGADAMIGGAGGDTYVVDDAGDTVVENAAEGNDTVQASISFTLGANVENLTLTGPDNIDGTGNSLNNTLTGNSGNNTLDGGSGADTMIGGAGNDSYVVDNASDTVIENAAEGIDTVQSSISYSLGANVENLTLTGSGNINGTGNNLDNNLTSNSGIDILSGGSGDDTYVLNNAFDMVIELTFDGTDTVQSSISYSLGANVENLTLTGSDNINGGGNGLNNILTSNSGIDLLFGGSGNDTYVVNNAFDTVHELTGEGTDAVLSSVSYTLGANVENLTLTGSANIDGTGNSLDNKLTGNSGNNTLDGGSGADTMIGGAGNDTYVVDNGVDTVIENAGEGSDTVQSSISYTLGANVENLTLTGSGNINGIGNTLNNTLTSNSGIDILVGGSGDDTYVVNNIADTVIENAFDGSDTVQSSLSYTLGANVENLTLTGSGNINGTGNSLNNTLTSNFGIDLLFGGSGDDTYVVNNTLDTVIETVSAGTDTVQASINYSLGANVENLTLTGSGNINGTGNSLNNTLTGNSGDNTLNGGSGADTMIGGAGGDTYIVDNAGDTVTENAAEGSDTVQASIGYSLGANVENLTLTGSANIDGTGNSLNNTLTGNSGNNTLDGGSGADSMTGGAGNDIYVVDDAGDTVVENAAEGNDTVQSSISYTLGANVESLTLTGSDNIDGTGNGMDSVLTGNSGNNTLDDGSGSGTMIGGAGNDTYVVDNAGDTVIENAAEGSDTVQSSISYSLGGDVENLTLTGSDNIDGTGNGLNNTLTGNSGNNTLTGDAGSDTLDGGSGADSMIGGAGADTYVVDNAGDTVTENAAEGSDTVLASISTILGADVENLTLTGSDNIDATGNSLNNTLTGNSGNNTLNGSGGADSMTGGAGNDIYGVNNAGDTVMENAAEGSDTVRSSISYSLGANVENLTLKGSGNIDGSGNGLNNKLTGNSGDNTLDAGSGGADSLYGLGGNDSFVFGSALAANDLINGGKGTDTVNLNGDYSAGVVFGATTMVNVETITIAAGHSYNLATADATVASGATLSVNGAALGSSDTLSFNGSAESNGLFHLTGGAGDDILTGGAKGDQFSGGGGADRLTGNAGGDVFIYGGASDSTSVHYDTIVGFNANLDKFDLTFAVTGIDTNVGSGSLSTASFDADLASAVGSAQLAANHAVLFAVSAGDLGGHTFLVVDANGTAGYQANADLVFDISGAIRLGQLGTATFI